MRVPLSTFCFAGLCVAALVALQPVKAFQANTPPAGKTEPGTTENGKTTAKPADTSTQTIRPGKDRWPVKTATDPDARSINPKPEKTSVESLLDLPRPVDLPLRESNPTMQEHRARPVETTVYSVEVDVTDCRLMPDGDYRVTLRGASGKTIVMEMPDTAPGLCSPDRPVCQANARSPHCLCQQIHAGKDAQARERTCAYYGYRLFWTRVWR